MGNLGLLALKENPKIAKLVLMKKVTTVHHVVSKRGLPRVRLVCRPLGQHRVHNQCQLL